MLNQTVAVIGAGPAGLMAAETLIKQGVSVHVYEAKPSVGRKFLMAGRGGLNITHSEPTERFHARYGARSEQMAAVLKDFDADALRDWVHGLGIDTFVGTSGRVFPQEMKAAPLLRAWLHRLREQGVVFSMRHRWLGWSAKSDLDTQTVSLSPMSDATRHTASHTPPHTASTTPTPMPTHSTTPLRFETPTGEVLVHADATILALGGGSWAKLGSDGAWMPWLEAAGVPVNPLLPSNGGFETTWSQHFIEQCAGEPIKTAAYSMDHADSTNKALRGECMVTEHGLEGGVIYALSAQLRDQIILRGQATLYLDLLPDHEPSRVLAEVTHPRGTRSMSSHLKSRLGLHGVRAALLRECLSAETFKDPIKLAAGIKALPIVLTACRPLDEAISTAGGVQFEGLTQGLMSKKIPGLFCAGEMLDWEAPTGGYLLNGVMASGRAAAVGVLNWLDSVK